MLKMFCVLLGRLLKSKEASPGPGCSTWEGVEDVAQVVA